MSNPLAQSRLVVVKIGSSTLIDSTTNDIAHEWLEGFAHDVAKLRSLGKKVVLVSSGAIALGRRKLAMRPGALDLEEAQAAAAVGQIALARGWSEALAQHQITVAQVLLTLGDTENRRRYLNARSTLRTLLDLGSVPVINENDTVATSEIRFGDNDRLAARVAGMLSADSLVLLSDIDGFYDSDPRENPGARLIPEIRGITPDIEAMAGKAGSDMGSGGMATKLLAARIATDAGIHMAIANGGRLRPLSEILSGRPCSWFVATASPASARKLWISGSLRVSGGLTIDAGAVSAISSGKSLLPVGVRTVQGNFERGDCVSICDEHTREVARGLIAYSSLDALRICGLQSKELETELGYRGRHEMIHRDDLVLIR